jgi:Flp pilus assembly protein TadB
VKTQRSSSELPGLKRFRSFCLFCLSVSLVMLLISSAITVVPRLEWVVAKVVFLSLLVSLYFFIIGLRTHVIIWQFSRDREQTFDRPVPEWITVSFLVCGVVVVFWPR